jgi:hypothetical protein
MEGQRDPGDRDRERHRRRPVDQMVVEVGTEIGEIEDCDAPRAQEARVGPVGQP